MIPETLTITERAILANQFRILAKLNDEDEDDNEGYISRAEILEGGLEGEYDKVFSGVKEDVVPENTSKEVMDIFDMFSRIQSAVNHLSKPERDQLDLKALRFRGFDGNYDFHQRRYISWWVKNSQGSYDDLENVEENSHSRLTIAEYRAMLDVYNSFGEYPTLTFERLKQLQGPRAIYR